MIHDAPNKKLFFFDESRFGTHSKIGHAWLETGKRTPMPIRLGFKNFYLYTAVAPDTGEHFTLEIPQIDTLCMNVYLQELSDEYSHVELILIMDGAGWHKSKDLVVPPNIEIVYLPPYSPELNPVERLWQHIKRYTIRNKVYKELSDLEAAVHIFYKGLSRQTFKSICTANYLIN